VVDDGYSKRRYYYYTRDTVLGLKPEALTEVYYADRSRQEEWFVMILQKT